MNPRQISAYPHDEKIQIDSHSNEQLATLNEASVSTVAGGIKLIPEIDTFGDIAGIEKVDRGWLTTETVFQFKLIRNPFTIKQKLKNRLLYVKVRNANILIKFLFILTGPFLL